MLVLRGRGGGARYREVRKKRRNFGFFFFVFSCSASFFRSKTKTLKKNSFDYEAFTGRPSHDGPPTPADILPESRRVPAAEVAARLLEKGGQEKREEEQEEGSSPAAASAAPPRAAAPPPPPPPLFIIDVRPSSQFGLARLPESVNVPWGSGGDAFLKRAAAAAAAAEAAATGEEGKRPPVVVVCRRGNDSQRAVAALDEALAKSEGGADIETLKSFLEGRPAPLVDVVGGLEGVAAVSSFEFPRY